MMDGYHMAHITKQMQNWWLPMVTIQATMNTIQISSQKNRLELPMPEILEF